MGPQELHTVWNDDVYFDQNACLTSWTGVVDDEFSISEGSIRDFIRSSNCDLYQKLHGLPAPTYSVKGDGVVIEECEDPSPEEVQGSGKLRLTTTDSGALGFSPTPSPQEHPAQDPDDVVLTIVDSVILGAFTFTLHHHDDDYVICCLHPTCSLPEHVVPKGCTFAGVRCNNKKDGDEPIPLVDFYCADCLDDVIKLHVDTILKLGNERRDLVDFLFDGTPKQEILRAAERLHPELIEKNLWKMYYPTEPPLDAGVGSNSTKGLRLRRQKQYEIQQILKKEKRDQLTQISTPDTTKPGSLVLFRPRNLPTYDKRYKKQGRQWTHDRDGREKPDPVPAIIDQPIPERGVSCWCGEPNDGRAMVQCSSEYCMFGLIHFDCTHLAEIPFDDGRYLCRYCQTDAVTDGIMLKEVEATWEDQPWGELASSESGNGESENELASTEREREREVEREDGEHDFEDDLISAASRFVAVNSQLEPWMALPEMKWSVSDEDLDIDDE